MDYPETKHVKIYTKEEANALGDLNQDVAVAVPFHLDGQDEATGVEAYASVLNTGQELLQGRLKVFAPIFCTDRNKLYRMVNQLQQSYSGFYPLWENGDNLNPVLSSTFGDKYHCYVRGKGLAVDVTREIIGDMPTFCMDADTRIEPDVVTAFAKLACHRPNTLVTALLRRAEFWAESGVVEGFGRVNDMGLSAFIYNLLKYYREHPLEDSEKQEVLIEVLEIVLEMAQLYCLSGERTLPRGAAIFSGFALETGQLLEWIFKQMIGKKVKSVEESPLAILDVGEYSHIHGGVNKMLNMLAEIISAIRLAFDKIGLGIEILPEELCPIIAEMIGSEETFQFILKCRKDRLAATFPDLYWPADECKIRMYLAQSAKVVLTYYMRMAAGSLKDVFMFPKRLESEEVQALHGASKEDNGLFALP